MVAPLCTAAATGQNHGEGGVRTTSVCGVNTHPPHEEKNDEGCGGLQAEDRPRVARGEDPRRPRCGREALVLVMVGIGVESFLVVASWPAVRVVLVRARAPSLPADAIHGRVSPLLSLLAASALFPPSPGAPPRAPTPRTKIEKVRKITEREKGGLGGQTTPDATPVAEHAMRSPLTSEIVFLAHRLLLGGGLLLLVLSSRVMQKGEENNFAHSLRRKVASVRHSSAGQVMVRVVWYFESGSFASFRLRARQQPAMQV